MVFPGEKEESVTLAEDPESIRKRCQKADVVKKDLKQTEGDYEILKTAIVRDRRRQIEKETTLKKKVAAIDEEIETLKKKMEETKALKDSVEAIKQEVKRFAKKIEDLKVDALTVEYNSFKDRKAKFDDKGGEKLKTLFVGLAVETIIFGSCYYIQQLADPSKFHGWIMALSVAICLIILALSIDILICVYDFIPEAKSLKTEKEGLEKEFRAVKSNGDTEAGPLDENAAKMAEDKADSLKEMPVRVMPRLCVAGLIVLVTDLCFIGQVIVVGIFFKLF